jgi:dihydroflavonol-4-reductase
MILPMWTARLYAPVHTALSRARGVPARMTRIALEELRGNRQVSHARAARELDYQPRPIRETIHDTLAWFAEQGQFRREPQP